MSDTIASYIEDRFRRPVPPDHYIVPGSSPVISFGDFTSASVATLALNPSRNEFLNRSGAELDGRLRRLETPLSLGVSTLAGAPAEVIEKAWRGCKEYFHRRPYGWFNPLEKILTGIGASYYDGSACHLDLVQWATDPVWGKINNPAVQAALVDSDREFLRLQLTREKISAVLLNGSGVWGPFMKAYGVTTRQWHRTIPGSESRVQFVEATAFGKVRIVGWSTNLQSSWGVTAPHKEIIANEVTSILGRI